MPLPQLFLHDEAATGVEGGVETRNMKAARMLREGILREQVLNDDNLLAEILSAPGNRKPLSEICELVKSFCAATKCSVDVYRTVMQEGMGIDVDKPDDMKWHAWVKAWCDVVQRPDFYFRGSNVFALFPTRLDPAASLKWADAHGLYHFRDYRSTLGTAAMRLDMAVIHFFYNTQRITLPNMVRVVDLVAKGSVLDQASSYEPTDLQVDAFLELLAMYDTLNTAYYSKEEPPHSMNLEPGERVPVQEVWHSMRQSVRDYATAADNNQEILQWIQEKEAEQAALERAVLANM